MDKDWILTADRLPQWTRRSDGTERALVLAKTRSGVVARAHFGRFDGWQVDGIDMDLDAVVAWTPLPPCWNVDEWIDLSSHVRRAMVTLTHDWDPSALAAVRVAELDGSPHTVIGIESFGQLPKAGMRFGILTKKVV